MFQSTPRGKIDPKLPHPELVPVSRGLLTRFATRGGQVCHSMLPFRTAPGVIMCLALAFAPDAAFTAPQEKKPTLYVDKVEVNKSEIDVTADQRTAVRYPRFSKH